MVSLSGFGCSVFEVLGVMDHTGCEELRQQEASLDTLVWLKLLFVPTLGIVILTLFLLEEYCYAHGNTNTEHSHGSNAGSQSQLHSHSHGTGTNGVTCTDPSHGHAHSHSSSASSSKDSSLSPLATASMLKDSALSLLGTAVHVAAQAGQGVGVPLAAAASVLGAATGASSEESSAEKDTRSQQFPYPFTLLSPRSTVPGQSAPEPCREYPDATVLPVSSTNASTSQGQNPCTLLAAAPRGIRTQVLAPGIQAAAQGHIALLGHAPTFQGMAIGGSNGAGGVTVRINVMQDSGESLVLAITPTTTLRDLFTHILSRQNLACWRGSVDSSSSGSGERTQPGLSASVIQFWFKGKELTNEKSTLWTLLGLPNINGGVNSPGSNTNSNSNPPSAIGSTTSATSALLDSLQECLTIHMSLAWESMYKSLLEEHEKDYIHSQNKVKQVQDEFETESEKFETLKKQQQKKEEELTAIEQQLVARTQEKSNLQFSLEQLKTSLSTESTLLQSEKKQKLLLEGSDEDRIELKKLEKGRATLKREMEELNSELGEFQTKQSKLTKECLQLQKECDVVREKMQGVEEELEKLKGFAEEESVTPATAGTGTTVKEAKDSKDKSAQVSESSSPATTSKSISAATTSTDATTASDTPQQPSIQSLTSHLESLERAFLDLQVQRKKVEFIQGEIAYKRSEVMQLARKVQLSQGLSTSTGGRGGNDEGGEHVAPSSTHSAASASGTLHSQSSSQNNSSHASKLDALPSLRARAAQLEKDTKDLLRWKSIAKHLELEAREAYRWKSLLRAAQQREQQQQQGKSHSAQGSLTNSPKQTPASDPTGATPTPLEEVRRRARALEKEVLELRAWKRRMDSGSSNNPANAQAGGDFYSTPAQAHAAGFGLGLGSGLAYDHDGVPVGDGVGAETGEFDSDESSGLERIEPVQAYVRAVLQEENAERAAKSAQTGPSNSAGTGGSNNTSQQAGHPTIIDGVLLTNPSSSSLSDELYAAEQEEERLVVAMNASSATRAGASTMSEAEQDEELFRLGEALVRRNQHLHQHRLMMRYQQQQQQQGQHGGSHTGQHHGEQDPSGGGAFIPASAQHQSHSLYQPTSNKSGLTGVLQASAPVFTPRYGTDVAPAPIVGGVPGKAGASAGVPSHYTKVAATPNQGNSASAGVTAFTPSASPTTSTLSWSTSPTNSSHQQNSSLDMLDSSSFWNSSLQALLDEMDSNQSSSASGTGSQQRSRAFSNPASTPPTHPHSSAHMFGMSGLTGQQQLPNDPFTAFRRSQGLVLIDDEEDDLDGSQGFFSSSGGGSHGMHGGIGGAGSMVGSDYHPFSSRSSLGATPLGGSGSLSRVHSGASSPSAQLFGSNPTNGLPPFFSLSQATSGGANQ